MARLMIYDDTTLDDGWDGWREDGLAYSWFAGGRLYRWVRWLDKVKGVGSWAEGLDWMLEEGKKEKISMIQYWGHGSPGNVWIGKESFNLRTLSKKTENCMKWKELSNYLTDDAVIWFRTCSTFGGPVGKVFASEFSKWVDCKVAAHTHIIGPLQGGLHSITPDQAPYWPDEEGFEVVDGKKKSVWSTFGTPNTITCLRGSIPEGW